MTSVLKHFNFTSLNQLYIYDEYHIAYMTYMAAKLIVSGTRQINALVPGICCSVFKYVNREHFVISDI